MHCLRAGTVSSASVAVAVVVTIFVAPPHPGLTAEPSPPTADRAHSATPQRGPIRPRHRRRLPPDKRTGEPLVSMWAGQGSYGKLYSVVSGGVREVTVREVRAGSGSTTGQS